MAVHVITQPSNPANPASDKLYRQQMEHAARVDDKETFKTVEVQVKRPGMQKAEVVKVRFAMDSTYAFVVYRDNPAFHTLDRAEWDAVAKDAIEKFAGIRELQVTFGPRPEDSNRYNIMAEFNRPIEQKQSTIDEMNRRRAEWEKLAERDRKLAELGLAPEFAQNYGPYQRIGA